MEINCGQVAITALRALPPTWAFRYRDKGQWKDIVAPRLAEWLEHSCRSLLSLGVKKGDRVGHFGPNLPEMFMADLAAMAIGAIGVVIPDGARQAQTPSYLDNARPKVLFVHGEEWARRLPGDIPHCQLVAYDAAAKAVLGDRALTWEAFLASGKGISKEEAEAARSRVKSEDPAFIIYTSGTTGRPKAITHSHGTFERLAHQMRDEYGLEPGEVVFAFVPLCHMPARLGMLLAVTEPFEPWMSPDLDTLAAQLQEVRPTFLPGVPRMFEKIRSVVLAKSIGAPGPLRALFQWSIAMGAGHHIEGRTDFVARLGYGMADALLLGKVRGALGGRVRRALCGGARVDAGVLNFFASLGINVRETYGMTEVGVIAIQPPRPEEFGHVGAPAKGVEIKLGEGGAIAVKSPCALLGYWDPEVGITPALREDGFFETGDIGQWREDNKLEILGRQGDAIRTSGGKTVAPGAIEAALNAIPYVERAILVGDGRPCPGALIVCEEESLRAWAVTKGLDLGPMERWEEGRSEGLQVLDTLLKEAVERAMTPFPSYERVKVFTLLPRALSSDEGEVTDSGKTRRHVVLRDYKEHIERMYDQG